MKTCVVGIDASRNRSGGARHHLIGLLAAMNPIERGIDRVHVWAYRALAATLPDAPWLVKHSPPELEQSLLRQIWWQRRALPDQLRRAGCDILLSTDAGTVGVFEPSIVMSRDMLSYEPGEMRRYGLSKAWLRLWLLRYVQARSLRRARGSIFLTRYASETIQNFTGPLQNVTIIPHGVGRAFRRNASEVSRWSDSSYVIRCVYVSNAELYKHQWQVIRAIDRLRRKGHRIVLTLAGGGQGKAQELIDKEIRTVDPNGEFVSLVGALAHDELPRLLAESDVFIFASSCENMPNTLVEGMASGLPIACSNRGPMPEVLQDGGVYFNPEDAESIADAIERIVVDSSLRMRLSERAIELATQFSWERCAKETWDFLYANAIR
jgi:glycosyltransferase involved in cell wall biosynthesis